MNKEIMKQIYQSVNFQGFSSGDMFTLNIGLYPICAQKVLSYRGIPSSVRIGFLLGKGDVWWEYNDASVEIVTDII